MVSSNSSKKIEIEKTTWARKAKAIPNCSSFLDFWESLYAQAHIKNTEIASIAKTTKLTSAVFDS